MKVPKVVSEEHSLADIRARIVSIKTELEDAHRLILSDEEIAENVRCHVEKEVEEAAKHIRVDALLSGRFSNIGDHAAATNRPAGFAYLLIGVEKSTDAIMSHVRACAPASVKRMSADERSATQARLAKKLLSAEIAEEALIRRTEASGLPLPRRKDARPEIFLAMVVEEVILNAD